MLDSTRVLAVLALLLIGAPAVATTPAAAAEPVVYLPARQDVSPPLRDILILASDNPATPGVLRRVPNRQMLPGAGLRSTVDRPDALRQATEGPLPGPTVDQSFEGMSNTFGVAPPDTNGDVGIDHYIQYINLGWQIFNKADGTPASPVMAGNTFWAGFGGACQTNNSGDPIVLYDHLADRWMFMQFTTSVNSLCFAVTTTADPMGPYNRYQYIFTNFPDYPKVGLWTDEGGSQSAYTLSTNNFAASFVDVMMAVVERDVMIAGGAAQIISFFEGGTPDETYFSATPSHLEGTILPDAGTCPIFMHNFDDEQYTNPPFDATDSYVFWELCADWATPGSSALTGPTLVDSGVEWDMELCNYAPCIAQPGTGQLLDVLAQQGTGSRLTMRRLTPGADLQYPYLHTVDVGGNQAGMRWTEWTYDGTFPPSLGDQGVYAPDSDNRWMASGAYDAGGNLAILLSLSSGSTFPSLVVTGRAPGDPAGTLRAETTCVAGGGSQTATERWGDYSSVSVDPVDQCTFWGTSEYITTTTPFTWRTRVCSFTMPNCPLDPDLLFTDGFESGDTTSWSTTVQ